VAHLTTAAIIASVILLMFLSFPLGEAEVNRGWYQWVYYGVLIGGAVTGGVFISTVLMLYYSVRELIGVAEDATGSTMVITSHEPD
ncbi:MAG: hypothetical protein ACKVKO_12410, partial [Acidimicrobiales bacterium]